MAELVAPILAAIGTAITAIGGPAVTSGLQNRREARLRRSIGANMELVGQLEKQAEPVQVMMPIMQNLINAQVHALVVREVRSLDKQRDWSSLGVVIFLIAAFGWFPVWMWSIHRWWATTLAYAVSILLVIFVVVGVWQTFWPTKKDASEQATLPEPSGSA